MPELPEVETLRRELDELLAGRIIKNVEVLWFKAVLPLTPTAYKKNLIGVKIEGADRRAKMLILNLNSNKFLTFHLKMTGQLIFVPKSGEMISGGHPTNDVQTPGKYTRIIFTLDNNSHLYFNDLRKFGWSRLLNRNELDTATEHYGPEPLSKNFTSKFLIEIFKQHPKSTIKKILLDQTLIAGIGNIYADEACFLAHLRPDRRVGTLNNEDITLLQEQIVAVLKLSIKHKGTSSRNYRRSDGSQGGFVPHLYVYGRSGDPCKVCNGTLVKIKHAGRGTHYCERCQS